MRLVSTVAPTLSAAAMLAACGGTPMEEVDSGPPAIGLTVHSARMIGSDGVMLPRSGYRFVALDITIAANLVGPIPVAPAAFETTLTDGTPAAAAPMPTNQVVNGCTSRSLPLGSSASCTVIFELMLGSADPATLVWSNGTYTIEAPVPPLSTG
jgi:hypothetical protein